MTRNIFSILLLFIVVPVVFPQDTTSTSITTVRTYSTIEYGEYMNWQDASEVFKNGIQINGEKTINKTSYFGGMGLEHQRYKQTLWPQSQLNPYPYIIVDFNPKNMIRNAFNLFGIYNYSFTKKMSASLGLSYSSGTDYNKRDPRYKIDDFAFKIEPSIKVERKLLKFVFVPFISFGRTELKMRNQIENNAIEVYQLLGLGLSQNYDLVDFYSLQTTKNDIGGLLDIGYTAKNTEFGIKIKHIKTANEIEKSNINWSVVIPEAALRKINTQISSNISFKGKELFHSFNHRFLRTHAIGKEYIRQQVLSADNKNEIWRSYGSNDKYTALELRNEFNYSLTKQQNTQSISLKTTLSTLHHNERYFGINNTYYFKYFLTEPSIYLSYSIQKKNLFRIESAYRKPLLSSSSLFLVEGAIADAIYHKQLRYLEENVNILSLNTIFGKHISINNRLYFTKLYIRGEIYIPETAQNFRSLMTLAIEVDF